MVMLAIRKWMQMLGTIVAILGTGLAIGVHNCSGHIGKLKEQNETLKISNDMKLPDLLSELKATNKELKTRMKTIGSIVELNNQLREIEDKLKQAEDKLREVKIEREKLLEKIEYYSQIVDPFYIKNPPLHLDANEVIYLFGKDIPVVWRPHGAYDMHLTINNRGNFLDVGRFVSFKYQGEKYKLVLDEVEKGKAKFVLLKDLAE